MFSRPCELCEKYEYDEDGEVLLEWDPAARKELPVLREPGERPPCHACEKVPDAVRQRKQLATTKADAVDGTERSKKTYRHWKGCHAVNDWPRLRDGSVDPHVRRNAGLIADLLRQRSEQQSSAKLDAVIALLSMLRVK